MDQGLLFFCEYDHEKVVWWCTDVKRKSWIMEWTGCAKLYVIPYLLLIGKVISTKILLCMQANISEFGELMLYVLYGYGYGSLFDR